MTPQYPPRLRVWSAEEWAWWFWVMEAQIDALEMLVLAAYPEGREEHVRARCLLLRLRAFLVKQRVALSIGRLRA